MNIAIFPSLVIIKLFLFIVSQYEIRISKGVTNGNETGFADDYVIATKANNIISSGNPQVPKEAGELESFRLSLLHLPKLYLSYTIAVYSIDNSTLYSNVSNAVHLNFSTSSYVRYAGMDIQQALFHTFIAVSILAGIIVVVVLAALIGHVIKTINDSYVYYPGRKVRPEFYEDIADMTVSYHLEYPTHERLESIPHLQRYTMTESYFVA